MSNKKEAYLCISALLRARELRLLNNEKAERMLDAADFADAARLLTDSGYPDMSEMDSAQVEQCLADRRDAIFEELGKLAPEPGLIDVFKLKYDYHNAKVIIKAEAMGTDARRLLSNSGRIPGLTLTELYNEEKRIMLPELLGAAMFEAKNVLARTGNPQLADFVLDKAYFAELQKAADTLDSPFLRSYITVLIDSTNLKSTVRTLRMGKGQDFLSEVLIPGGGVAVEKLASVSDKESLALLFSHSALEKAAALGGDSLDGSSMTAFELACDNAVTAFLKDSKLMCYGVATVLAYMAAVEGEITAVRMILTGRLAGVAPQVIRERLRDLYA